MRFLTISVPHSQHRVKLRAYDIASIEVNSDVVEKLLLNLDPSKSARPDELPSQFLINCAKGLVKPIMLLFQRSFTECNYTHHYNFRTNRIGGGVSAFVHNDLKHT